MLALWYVIRPSLVIPKLGFLFRVIDLPDVTNTILHDQKLQTKTKPDHEVTS